MVRRYCVIALMLLCVCLAVQPITIAYAVEVSPGGDFSYKVVYGPTLPTITSTEKQVQVYAPNNYEAALIVLGYQNDSRLTDDARALLSNQSTGGTFYDFAQGFSNNNDYWGNQLMFQYLGMNSALTMNNRLYGANNIWSSEYDKTMYDGAKQRVEAILNGDSSGGGSGGGSGGNDNGRYINFIYYPDTILTGIEVVRLDTNGLSSSQIDWSQFKSGVLGAQNYSESSNTFGADINLFTDIYTAEQQPDTRYKAVITKGDYVSFATTFRSSIEGNVLTISAVAPSNIQIRTPSSYPFGIWMRANYGVYNGQSDDNPIPPTNWPENPTPTPPEPPEVPTPTDPVIPTQPPEPVDPTSPTYPVIVYEPDYVWQTADLSAILSAMDAHCRHLQTALHRECSNLWANFSVKLGNEFKTLRTFLHGQFGWLVDSIDEEFDDFELYLKSLFEWLAEQMEFSFTGGGYDDNTVISWLKKIYYKLGGGTNTRPVDPTVEPDNWWDWLTRLIADWIAGLTDMGLDELAGLLELLQELITKFPFSIPWDIAALLALLVSQPVTPEIRMPQMALTGSGLTQVGEYVVNLSDYNAVWEGVRFIEKVGFCIFLAWNTVHFMDLFKKGANTE